MAREEAENGRDDMQIDGPVPEPERGLAVPDGFNPDYLKIYYGNCSCSTNLLLVILIFILSYRVLQLINFFLPHSSWSLIAYR